MNNNTTTNNLTSSNTTSTNLTNNNNEIVFGQEQLQYFLSKFKLKMFVYDYDRGFLSDDLIGYANIDLTALNENKYLNFFLILKVLFSNLTVLEIAKTAWK
jgi:hypothetical protein